MAAEMAALHFDLSRLRSYEKFGLPFTADCIITKRIRVQKARGDSLATWFEGLLQNTDGDIRGDPVFRCRIWPNRICPDTSPDNDLRAGSTICAGSAGHSRCT